MGKTKEPQDTRAFWDLMWRMDLGRGYLCTADGPALITRHGGYDPRTDPYSPAGSYTEEVFR